MPEATKWNPCVTCGACCAHYRASFYWTETDDIPGGTVPVDMTERLDLHLRVMKGTNQSNPRCIALEGEIGSCVRCRIYDYRAGVCREFLYSLEDGIRNEHCDKARAAWGLGPLEPPVFPKSNKTAHVAQEKWLPS